MDYTFEVDENNVAVVKYLGEEIWQSRACRLRVQAERLAMDWIQNSINEFLTNNTTLDVQSMSIDPDSLFGGK